MYIHQLQFNDIRFTILIFLNSYIYPASYEKIKNISTRDNERIFVSRNIYSYMRVCAV